MIRWMVLAGAFAMLTACFEEIAPRAEGDSDQASMEEGRKKGKGKGRPQAGEEEAPISDCAEAWHAYDVCRDLAQIACEETIDAFEACIDAHGGGAPIPTPGMDPWDDVLGPQEDELPEECLPLFSEVMACQMACVDEYVARAEACQDVGPDCPGEPEGSWESGGGSGGAGGWDDPPPTRCDIPEDGCPGSAEGGGSDWDD